MIVILKTKTKSHNLIKVGEDLKKFEPLGFAGGDRMVVTAIENRSTISQEVRCQIIVSQQFQKNWKFFYSSICL